MNFYLRRVANKREDCPRGLGCLFMGEAAKRIDNRLGRPITSEEDHILELRARDAELVLLVGHNYLDVVWLDVSPGEISSQYATVAPSAASRRCYPTSAPS